MQGRKFIAAAAAAAALIATSASPAMATPGRHCRPALRFDAKLTVKGASCRLARKIERYTATHETHPSFFPNAVGAGYEWVMTRWTPTMKVYGDLPYYPDNTPTPRIRVYVTSSLPTG